MNMKILDDVFFNNLNTAESALIHAEKDVNYKDGPILLKLHLNDAIKSVRWVKEKAKRLNEITIQKRDID